MKARKLLVCCAALIAAGCSDPTSSSDGAFPVGKVGLNSSIQLSAGITEIRGDTIKSSFVLTNLSNAIADMPVEYCSFAVRAYTTSARAEPTPYFQHAEFGYRSCDSGGAAHAYEMDPLSSGPVPVWAIQDGSMFPHLPAGHYYFAIAMRTGRLLPGDLFFIPAGEADVK